MLRHLHRQRLDVHLDRHLGEDAALLHPDGIADQGDRDGRVDQLVEADLLEVDVRDHAANEVPLVLLEHRRVRLAPIDDHVEHRVQAARS